MIAVSGSVGVVIGDVEKEPSSSCGRINLMVIDDVDGLYKVNTPPLIALIPTFSIRVYELDITLGEFRPELSPKLILPTFVISLILTDTECTAELAPPKRVTYPAAGIIASYTSPDEHSKFNPEAVIDTMSFTTLAVDPDPRYMLVKSTGLAFLQVTLLVRAGSHRYPGKSTAGLVRVYFL